MTSSLSDRPRIAINGFGRLGRMVLRHALSGCFKVVAINEPLYHSAARLAYLLKYDSSYGSLGQTIFFDDSVRKLYTAEQEIRLMTNRSTETLDWTSVNADYVIDCTGEHMPLDQATEHVECGAKKVLIAAPSPDAPLVMYGMNMRTYKPEMQVVSLGSPTTNCLVPLLSVLHDSFGIQQGVMTTVQPLSNSQCMVDGQSEKLWRHGRGSLQSIIPVANGAAREVCKVLPELSMKLTGMGVRVPTVDVSLVDLTVRLLKPTTYEDILGRIKQVADAHLKGIMGYTEDEVVSVDVRKSTLSCLVDANAGCSGCLSLYKVVSWHGNEYAQAKRAVDMVQHMYDKDMHAGVLE